MKGWLLDTNVVSELRKPACDPNVKAWSERYPPESFHLSTVTLAEIRYGIERQKNAAFRRELTDWLDRVLRPWFAGRILDVDEDTILEWRRMVAAGRKRGITYGQPDLFIAASAKVHGLTVVTRNVADFERAAVDTVDPWRSQEAGIGR